VLTVDRFRWAVCQLDTLENCRDYRTLQTALSSLPKTLDETYSRIIRGIPEEDKDNAIRILQFLTYSERPLSIEEAVDALAVDTKGEEYFNAKYRMPDPSEILYNCSSLMVLVSAEDDPYNDGNKTAKLQLAHYSVKEYLTSNLVDRNIAQDFQEIAAKASIATVCLAYLLHLDMELPAKEIEQRFPLAQYSAKYWIAYAAVAENEHEILQDFVRKFFYCHRNSYKICYNLHRPDTPWDNEPFKRGKESASALYYASFGGLVNAVKYLLSKDADVNAQGGYYGNALQAASYRGHDRIVELLLSKDADINAQGGHYGNALQAASYRGHDRIVELLLSKDADINAQGGYLGNTLQAASYGGHDRIVELLLSKDADINAQGGDFGNALQAASVKGHDRIVELLLSKDADINAQGGYYSNALQAASSRGHDRIVELLLSKDADINAQGGYYGNALQAASYGGHDRIVELLLSKDADVNAQGGHYGNALQAASSRGHDRIVKLLLSKDADINAQGGYYGNALQAASYGGHDRIVELLLSKDADY
jgi:ankyrin repeat protein